jgi:5-methylcytosine-specific restriction endonuclease McrA
MANPELPPHLVCRKCGVTKPHTREFYSAQPYSEGQKLKTKCKVCYASEQAARRAANPQKFAEAKRAARALRKWSPDIEAVYPLRRCSKCKETKPNNPDHFSRGGKRDGLAADCKECDAAYHAQNRERANKVNRAAELRRRAADPATFKEKRNSWRQQNRERINREHRQWRNENADKVRPQRVAHQAKRRAKAQMTGGSFTRHDTAKLLSAQKRRCWWCSEKLTAYHVDHRIPLSKGGSNDVSNLVISCPSCNLKKSAKLPWEFTSRLL